MTVQGQAEFLRNKSSEIFAREELSNTASTLSTAFAATRLGFSTRSDEAVLDKFRGFDRIAAQRKQKPTG